MIESNDNPLGLENKLYDIEEFGATLRNKFGADDNISNVTYDVVTKKDPYDSVWVIGGEQIYSWYIKHNLIRDVYITNINLDVECDIYFPKLPDNFVKLHAGKKIMSKEHKILYNIDIFRNKDYDYSINSNYDSEIIRRLDLIEKYGVI